MICNVCKHLVRSLGKEWKCDNGCRCLMLGCIAVEIPQPTLNAVDRELNMKMMCVDCGKMRAKLGQKRCPDCERAFKTFEPEVRVWVDDIEQPGHKPDKPWCNCTRSDSWHGRGEGECIHMRPSTGVVNR